MFLSALDEKICNFICLSLILPTMKIRNDTGQNVQTLLKVCHLPLRISKDVHRRKCLIPTKTNL